jgi:hypothetical protein
MPNKLVIGMVESMNKVGYIMLAWVSIIFGNFLSFSGFITDVWVSDTVRRGGISDVSAFSSIYTLSSVLVLGGMILIVVGIVFIWRAHRASVKA